MTAPFSLDDLLNDPEWRKQMESTALGRKELARLDAQKRQEEAAQALAQAKGMAGRLTPTEQQRMPQATAALEQNVKEQGRQAETGLLSGTGTSPMGQLGRGAALGLAQATPSFLDMLLSVPDRMTGGGLTNPRQWLQEKMAAAEQGSGVTSSPAASVGEFAGGIVGGLPLYGPLAGTIARPVAAGLDALGAGTLATATRAAGGIAKAGDIAPGRLMQGLGNVMAGLPISAYAQVGMDPGTTAGDRLQNLGIQTAADMAFGALMGHRPGRPMGPVIGGDVAKATEVPAVGSAGKVILEGLDKDAAEKAAQRAVQETEKAAKAEQRKILRQAQKEYDAKASLDATVAYQTAKAPGDPAWNKLPQEKRAALVEEWKKANPFQPPEAAAPPPAAATTPVDVPKTDYPVGTTLKQADGGTITKQSDLLWSTPAGLKIPDSHVAMRAAEFEVVPKPATVTGRVVASEAPATEASPFEVAPLDRPVEKATATVEAPTDAPPVGFTTSKGSTYTILDGGSTIRNKAPRPEHPGDVGVKPASTRTYYVDADGATRLGEAYAEGHRTTIAEVPGQPGSLAVLYQEGPSAGKFERRTVTQFQTEPAVGLHPVEVWDNGSIHIGNDITEVRKPPTVASALPVTEPVPQPSALGVDPNAPPAQVPTAEAQAAATVSPPVEVAGTSPNLDNTQAVTPFVPPAEAQPVDAQKMRRWWNSLSANGRESWLRRAGWEPASEADRAASVGRYDALTKSRYDVAAKAYQLKLGEGEPAVVAPKAPRARRAATPETVALPAGQPFEYSRTKLQRPAKLSTPELEGYITETQKRFDAAGGAEKLALESDLNKLLNEQKKRRLDEGGKVLQSPASIGGAAGGLLVGIQNTDPDDPDRSWKLAAYMAAGAVAGGLAQRLAEPRLRERREAQNRQLPTPKLKEVISIEDQKGGDMPMLTRSRAFYTGLVRSIADAERVADGLVQYNQQAARKFKQLLGLFGHYISNTENAFTTGLAFRDPQTGEPIYITKDDDHPTDPGGMVWPIRKILEQAKNDKEGLGELATALRTIERIGDGIVKNPMTEEQARHVVANAPEHMIQAVQELRDYHLGLAKMMMMQGKITKVGYEAMKAKKYYTPFYYFLEGGAVRNLEQFDARNVGTPNPLKAQKKGEIVPIRNPVDQTIILTPRYLKSIEFGQVTQSLIDLARSIGDKEVSENLAKRISPRGDQAAYVKQQEAMAKTVAKELGVGVEDITGLVTHGDDELPAFKADVQGGYFTNWEGGTLVTYRTKSNAIFEGLKSLLPMERDILTGMFQKVSSAAGNLVVGNPVFIFKQFFKDSMDLVMMSKYGANPFTNPIAAYSAAIKDPFRALGHIYGRTPAYRRMLDMGGPGTVQSIKYLDPERAMSSITAEGKNAFVVAGKQIKAMHWLEAYQTLAMPFAEAGRVAEYLRALDHGETTLEAVYAAWNVFGNTRVQGSSAIMHFFNRITPFMRASIAAMDEQAARAGVGMRTAEAPGGEMMGRVALATRFVTRGAAHLAMPTLLLWAFQKDDEELRAIQNTEWGQTHWLIRPKNFGLHYLGVDPETIIAIPRPHIPGVLFAASADAAADMAAKKDPVAAESWAAALRNQLWINTVPTVGVVTIGMLTGKDVSFGPADRSIVPEWEQKMDPSEQGRLTASLPARIVGQTTGKLPVIGSMLSPPMLDFIGRTLGGTTGQDVLRGLTQVQDYLDNGYVPAKYELPVMRSFFTKLHGTNVAPVEKFYRYADKMEGVYLALQSMQRNDPQKAWDYWQKHQDEVRWAPLLAATRDRIGQYRKAGVDLREMGKEYATPERRRELEAYFANLITREADMAVRVIEAQQAK